MIFIELSELKIRKFQSIIDDISDDDNYIISELETIAIEQVKSYLINRYDTFAIFSRTGTDRSPLIRRIVMDYMTCMLFERLSTNEIPVSVQERCEKNTEFLKDIAKGVISPDLPKLDPNLEATSMFQGGSESAFNNSSIN